jgi:hypothetical protein
VLKIETDQWLKEMERLSAVNAAKNAAGLTTAEWAERLGISIVTARSRLRRAEKLGRLVVGSRVAPGLGGVPRRHTVYRIEVRKR